MWSVRKKNLLFFSLTSIYVIAYNVGRKNYFYIPFVLCMLLSACMITLKYHKSVYLYKITACLLFLHIGNNQLYQIVLGTENIYLYYILTIVILFFENIREQKEEYSKRRFAADFIVSFLLFGYMCAVTSKRTNMCLGIILYFILVFWTHRFIKLIINIINFACSKHIFCTSKKNVCCEQKHDWRMWWILFFIVFAAGFFFSVVFYPGIIVTDNIYFYESGLSGNLRGASDIHSFAFLAVFALIFSITKNYYAITFLMGLLFALTWASVFSYLCSKGIKKSIVIIITFLWLSFPSTALRN